MRLDKFLKVSRLIKRRTLAQEICQAGRVLVNGKMAKSGHNLKVGDKLTLIYGSHDVQVEVLQLKETIRKEEAKELYRPLNLPHLGNTLSHEEVPELTSREGRVRARNRLVDEQVEGTPSRPEKDLDTTSRELLEELKKSIQLPWYNYEQDQN